MFVLWDPSKQMFPIKIWLEDLKRLDEGCIAQALNLANLPFLHKWVALMPDAHEGFGMPIGGVIALKDTIIPNAVGDDIGCGVAYVQTNLNRADLGGKLLQEIVHLIMKRIPTGFEHHKKKQPSTALRSFEQEMGKQLYKSEKLLLDEIANGYYQIGTLGGGNHFIEIQEDAEQRIGIMLHSGSRNFGYKIARYFNEIARQLNNKSRIIPQEYDLAFLPAASKEGVSYLRWMNLALDFASENREVMCAAVKDIISRFFPAVEFSGEINAHHNYVARESHYGEMVWVHRKGAIKATEGELGIIPGAMGSYSYIVQGLGNKEAFFSCSHGAGRKMGRKEALRQFSTEATLNDLNKLGVVLGKHKKSDIAEESRFAYKDIDFVISQELDLVQPIKKLKTVAVVKG